MQFSVALSSIWQLVSRTNKYIDETEPWVLAREEKQKSRLGHVMAHLAESLRKIAVLLQPFLTEAPKEIFKQLGVADESLQIGDSLYKQNVIKEGTRVQKGQPLFPRLEVDEEVETIQKMMRPTVEQPADQEEAIEQITFDEFTKMDLRVAEVLEAEKVK